MIVGDIGFCTQKNRSASVRSLDFVTAFELKYEEFMGILENTPKEDLVGVKGQPFNVFV